MTNRKTEKCRQKLMSIVSDWGKPSWAKQNKRTKKKYINRKINTSNWILSCNRIACVLMIYIDCDGCHACDSNNYNITNSTIECRRMCWKFVERERYYWRKGEPYHADNDKLIAFHAIHIRTTLRNNDTVCGRVYVTRQSCHGL